MDPKFPGRAPPGSRRRAAWRAAALAMLSVALLRTTAALAETRDIGGNDMIVCSAARAGDARCELTGVITRSQADGLRRFMKSHASAKNFSLSISSPGGDVEAAMRIGTMLREHEASVMVRDECTSACVLVLAGAVARRVDDGRVGIHRPYRTDAVELGAQRAQRAYEMRNNAVGAYLRRMNIPVSLLDAMLAVPSHETRFLNAQELRDFGLSGMDPVYEEERNAIRAKKLGLSMPDYLARRKMHEDCRANQAWSPESSNTCGARFPIL